MICQIRKVEIAGNPKCGIEMDATFVPVTASNRENAILAAITYT